MRVRIRYLRSYRSQNLATDFFASGIDPDPRIRKKGENVKVKRRLGPSLSKVSMIREGITKAEHNLKLLN